MNENQFIKKYRGKEFIIEKVEEKDLYAYTVIVDNKVLTEEEEDLFFIFYGEMETIYESNKREIVKWPEQ